jgi:hypothetical protein
LLNGIHREVVKFADNFRNKMILKNAIRTWKKSVQTLAVSASNFPISLMMVYIMIRLLRIVPKSILFAKTTFSCVLSSEYGELAREENDLKSSKPLLL